MLRMLVCLALFTLSCAALGCVLPLLSVPVLGALTVAAGMLVACVYIVDYWEVIPVLLVFLVIFRVFSAED